MKRVMKWLGWIGLSLAVILAASYMFVSYQSEEHISYKLEELPDARVAVMLGTSRFLRDGRQNLYFKYRIDAAARLFHQGKVDYILVSGDNSQKSYNEPRAMLQALEERGVPSDRIVLDYAGFRTLDSMIRAKEVFGQDEFIVVSQKFHNERAVCIARAREIEAYGYNARDVTAYAGFKTRFREVFARVKMLIDLYVINKQPRYLGEEVIIPEL